MSTQSHSSPLPPPILENILSPLLSSLPTASISPSPPTALLPLLSPILRQRVQLLSEASKDPWLPLLCYDESKAGKLEAVVNNERFEPHPVSNEVEVDWENDVEAQYRRIDEETLQSLVTLREFELAVRLVYCVGDEVGGGDGWRIGEVLVADEDSQNWGAASIGEAESGFTGTAGNTAKAANGAASKEAQEEEEDDDYWAQYDNTPAQTPGPTDTRHNAPAGSSARGGGNGATDEDSYYAQYASVQPAMDNHDPDEAHENGHVESSLGKEEVASHYQAQLATHHEPDLHDTSEAWSENHVPVSKAAGDENDMVLHPRPSSSQSSGSERVAKLERLAEDGSSRETSELGIKQHIGTSIKSLWRLARVVGMERDEFDRVVRTELDCLGMMNEED